MSYYLLSTYALYASIAASVVCSVVANANLHPDKKDPLRVFFWRAKSDFSETGWRFRQASVGFVAIAVALIPISSMLQFFERH